MNLYPWLEKSWHQLQSQLNAGRLHHALFITSPDGMGKLALAKFLSQTLLCKEPVNWLPCGHCHGCQLFETSVHPDFSLITSDAGKVIPIDVIRSLSQKLTERSQLGGNKVVIIDQADKLNLASANALLKTLEEPTAGTYIILLAESKAQVLPTINSRCQKMHITKPDELSVMAWLELQKPVSPPNLAALRLNQGAPLHTLAYLNNGLDSIRLQILKDIELLSQDPLAIARLSSALSENPTERLTWLQFWLLDLQKIKKRVAPDFVANNDQLDWLETFHSTITEQDIFYLQSELAQVRADLKSNSSLNTETLIMSFLIKLKRYIN